MADDDDLGDFFDEINQIEETADTGESKSVTTLDSVQPYTSSKSVGPELNQSSQKTPAASSMISRLPELLTIPKSTEFVAVNRAVYTYGVAPTLDNGSADSFTDVQDSESSGSSSSSNRNSSIGPSIGPIGPPTGPRPPLSTASHSYPQHSTGGLNLSLHTFSTSYSTSIGNC